MSDGTPIFKPPVCDKCRVVPPESWWPRGREPDPRWLCPGCSIVEAASVVDVLSVVVLLEPSTELTRTKAALHVTRGMLLKCQLELRELLQATAAKVVNVVGDRLESSKNPTEPEKP